MTETTVEFSDEYYASKIRETIKNLNKIVCEAQETGLIIKLDLGMLGQKSWVGYHDAASIIRKY